MHDHGGQVRMFDRIMYSSAARIQWDSRLWASTVIRYRASFVHENLHLLNESNSSHSLIRMNKMGYIRKLSQLVEARF